MTRQRLTREQKFELSQKIYDDFSKSFNEENKSFSFLKLDSQKKSKEFRSLEEGLEALFIWVNKGIINSSQKLDLINVLVQTNLPHIYNEPGVIITRRSFCLRSNIVTDILSETVERTKEKIKPKYKPKPGEL